jgi:serine/threonine protein kinase
MPGGRRQPAWERLSTTTLENSTTAGATGMTRKYAAPEVIAGEPRNSSSDVFSLGCVFIEMASALRPDVIKWDETQSFATSMPGIRDQLRYQIVTFEPLFVILFHAIREMTRENAATRADADHLMRYLTSHPAFYCDECKLLDVSPAVQSTWYM